MRLPERRGLSPSVFVGRGRELASLVDALAGPPVVVLVEGEAGMGKSRLVRELVATHPEPSSVLVAACPPFREPLTLAPVVDALRRVVDDVRGLGLTDLAGALRPLFPEWTDALPPPPEPAEDATASRHRLFRALAELLGRLGVSVMVVEDMHWADEATVEFLLFLVSRHDPVDLVLTYRQEDMPADTALLRVSSRPQASTIHRITLAPLEVDDTAAVVSSMLNDEDLSEEFASFLQERTGGVPLAIEESVRLMHERTDIAFRDGRWVRVSLDEIAVPESVRDAVLERAARLTDQARAVLNAVAVLGDPSDQATAIAVSGLTEDAACDGLTEALAVRLLHEDERGVVSFGHTLACRAVYDAVPAPQRRVLHLRAVRALEAVPGAPVDRLARHSHLAGEDTKWLRYAERAAELALAAGDEISAGTLLSDLLTGIRLPVDTVVRLTKKVPFAALTGPARCRQLVGVLRGTLRDGGLESSQDADVRAQLGRILTITEEYEEARVELERAVVHLRHDPMESVRVMLSLARPRGTLRPAAELFTWVRRASEITASMSAADQLGFLVEYATVLLLLGREEGWQEVARIPAHADTAQERLQVARGQVNIGERAMIWGRYSLSRSWLDRVATDDEHHYPNLRELALANLVRLDWLTGNWGGLAERAAAMAESTRLPPVSRLEAELVTALLAAASGTRDDALERLERVLAEGLRRSALESITGSAAALATIRLASGEVREALAATEDAIRVVASTGIWILATELAPARLDALVAAGRIEDAAELVAGFGRGLRGRDAPAARAALLACRAALTESRGEHARAAAGFARAAAAFDALPRRYDALLAGERRAACLLWSGRTQAGVDVLTEVLDGLSTLGAAAGADRVARRLRELGVTPRRPGRGGRPSYGERLSPREAEVVRHLVAGRTDREIAEALFLSPWTVRRHLYSARQKLNVPSRTALAVAAATAGVLDDTRADGGGQPARSPGPPS